MNKELILKLYSDGLTSTEIAKETGSDSSSIRKFLRSKGLGRGRGWKKKNGDTGNISEYISKATNGAFEYVGGYTTQEGSAEVRCKTCGKVSTIPMGTIRSAKCGGYNVRCPHCKDLEDQARALVREKEFAEKERERIKAKFKTDARKTNGRQLEFLFCKECGIIFVPIGPGRRSYCSAECAKRALNHKKDRRVNNTNEVDKDITLKKLYDRDDGICYMCKRVCDWADIEVRDDGVMIAGDSYPSIEHVIPLCKGGKHSWVNVRLACRKCNTMKRDRILPLVKNG